jgi:two-component system chemotaxis sensor kinase CheA
MGIYSNLEIEFDAEIVDEFLSHFTIMTGVLENLIIGLKKEENFQTNIGQIFMIMHNIKSASGYLQIPQINKVVSLAEEILDDCREVSGNADDELIDWLLLVSDYLIGCKEDLTNDYETYTKIPKELINIPKELVAH